MLDERFMEVLTPAQQDKWKGMAGEPFDGIGGGPFGESSRGPGTRGGSFGRRLPFGPR